MAFRRTLVKLAGIERSDVSPSLKKLWKKYYPVEGQITQHLSPFEQNVTSSMFHDAPKKILKKVKDFLLEAGPGLSWGVALYYYAEWKHKQIAFHHRV